MAYVIQLSEKDLRMIWCWIVWTWTLPLKTPMRCCRTTALASKFLTICSVRGQRSNPLWLVHGTQTLEVPASSARESRGAETQGQSGIGIGMEWIVFNKWQVKHGKIETLKQECIRQRIENENCESKCALERQLEIYILCIYAPKNIYLWNISILYVNPILYMYIYILNKVHMLYHIHRESISHVLYLICKYVLGHMYIIIYIYMINTYLSTYSY